MLGWGVRVVIVTFHSALEFDLPGLHLSDLKIQVLPASGQKQRPPAPEFLCDLLTSPTH